MAVPIEEIRHPTPLGVLAVISELSVFQFSKNTFLFLSKSDAAASSKYGHNSASVDPEELNRFYFENLKPCGIVEVAALVQWTACCTG